MKMMRSTTFASASLAALAVLLLAFFFYRPTNNWRWDPSFYYAQIRSPIIDGDFNYRDETIPPNGVSQSTEKGLQPSLWPVGPSILWGPFFLAAHGLMLALKPDYANGFSTLYVGLVSAGSALLGLLGVLALYKMCRLFSQARLALLTTVLALFATPLFFYTFRQPLMAHSSSFLFATLVILASVLFEQDKIPLKWSGLILGGFSGVYATLRWSGLLMAIIPIGLLSFRIWKALQADERYATRQALAQLGIFLGMIFLSLTPQFATWYQLNGKWLVNPQFGQIVPFTPIFYLNILFHTNRGLIFWSPFILIGLAGLIWLPLRRLRNILILYVALYILPVAFRWDWYGGGGFGTRYFLELLPIASLGFLALVQRWSSRAWHEYAIIAISVLLILHQMTLMIAVENLGRIDWVKPDDYNRGRPIGAAFFITTPVRVLQRPELWLGGEDVSENKRQAVFFSLLPGTQAPGPFPIPLIGMALLPLGVLAFWALGKLSAAKTLLWVAVLLTLHQVGWCIYFLSVQA
jgi:hypothetical protein